MKFTFCLLFVVFAVATCEDGASQEGIFKNLGKLAKKELAKLGKTVAKDVMKQAGEIVSEHFKFKPHPDVEKALQSEPSHEGILDFANNAIFIRAEEISQKSPSHEAAAFDLGAIPAIYEAEQEIGDVVVESHEGPSHEGIFGVLGKVVVKGLGSVVKGVAADAIKGTSGVLGNIFFSYPTRNDVSHEAIATPQSPSQEGIFNTLGKLLAKGTSKLALALAKGVTEHAAKQVGNIFLAQGTFKSYRTVESPAQELIMDAKNFFNEFSHGHPNAGKCIKEGEERLAAVFKEFAMKAQHCVGSHEGQAKNIFSGSQIQILHAIEHVASAHREIHHCYKSDKPVHCLEHEVIPKLAEHNDGVLHNRNELAKHVQQMIVLNNHFDVCLVEQLGHIRKEVHEAYHSFMNCLHE